jgi:hypothetical protein
LFSTACWRGGGASGLARSSGGSSGVQFQWVSMRRKLLLIGTGLTMLLILALAGMVVLIRSGLQRSSDDAVARFPGDRVEALMQVADCDTCALADRNNAVWALGQMAEERAISVLRKHYDGKPCTHASRLCQYELRKAIRMIETREQRSGPVWRLVAGLHRPWR